jgi:hypothetical protein
MMGFAALYPSYKNPAKKSAALEGRRSLFSPIVLVKRRD